jgi:diguanylate cyclase (GGDEF)-like protein
MLTQEMVTVLLIALAVNAIVVVSLIVAPHLRGWSQRRSSARPTETGHSVAARLAALGAEAGQPSFPTGSGAGAMNGSHAPGEPTDLAVPAASVEPANAAVEPVLAAIDAAPVPEMASTASWTTWLAEEAARAGRYQRPATIVLVELAGLERLADRVGRPAADRLIPPVVATIHRHARSADRLARLSPTRFGVLLVETDEVSAINYVERIRSNCDVWLAAGAVSLRLSIGWAGIRPDRSIDAVVRDAEKRLFDDRRRTEPVDPAAAADGHDRSAVLQVSPT